MDCRGPITGLMALALAMALPGLDARAADSAFVITGADLKVHRSATELRVNPQPGFTQIGRPHRETVGIIVNPVLAPDAAVDEAVARTPALPHMIRMQIGQTTTLIDPRANYRGEHPGGLDHNHSIIRAQRTFEALRARGARVIRGPAAAERDPALSVEDIRPRAILLRPNVMDQPAPQADPPTDMPAIPRPRTDLDHPRIAAAH